LRTGFFIACTGLREGRACFDHSKMVKDGTVCAPALGWRGRGVGAVCLIQFIVKKFWNYEGTALNNQKALPDGLLRATLTGVVKQSGNGGCRITVLDISPR
jgi:hypothetical protein